MLVPRGTLQASDGAHEVLGRRVEGLGEVPCAGRGHRDEVRRGGLEAAVGDAVERFEAEDEPGIRHGGVPHHAHSVRDARDTQLAAWPHTGPQVAGARENGNLEDHRDHDREAAERGGGAEGLGEEEEEQVLNDGGARGQHHGAEHEAGLQRAREERGRGPKAPRRIYLSRTVHPGRGSVAAPTGWE